MRVDDQSVSKKARYPSPVSHRAHRRMQHVLQSDNDFTATAAATHLQQHVARQLAHMIPWTYLYVHLHIHTWSHLSDSPYQV